MIHPKHLFDFYERHRIADMSCAIYERNKYHMLMASYVVTLNDGTPVTFRFNYHYPTERQGQLVIETHDFVYRQSLKIWFRWGSADNDEGYITTMKFPPAYSNHKDTHASPANTFGASCVGEPTLFVKKEDREEAETVLSLFLLEQLLEEPCELTL